MYIVFTHIDASDAAHMVLFDNPIRAKRFAREVRDNEVVEYDSLHIFHANRAGYVALRRRLHKAGTDTYVRRAK